MARLPDPALADKRRRQILDAAMVCFCRRGFHQTTMQEICAAAALSPGALYRYFPSKADLISAIAEEDRRAILEPLDLFGENADFFASAAALARAWLGRMQGKDCALIADVMAQAARDEELRVKLAEVDASLRDVLAQWVRQGQARHQVDARIDAARAARAMLCALDGMALRMVLLENCQMADAVTDLIFVFERMFSPLGASTKVVRENRGVMEPVA